MFPNADLCSRYCGIHICSELQGNLKICKLYLFPHVLPSPCGQNGRGGGGGHIHVVGLCLCEEQLLLFLGGGGKVEAVLSVGCCNLLSCCGLGATEEDDGMKQVPNRFWPISDGWASLPSETWLILYSP